MKIIGEHLTNFQYSTGKKPKEFCDAMLRQDFKILSLKSDDDEVHEEPEKEKSGFLLEQNRFRKETLRILHSCELKYPLNCFLPNYILLQNNKCTLKQIKLFIH